MQELDCFTVPFGAGDATAAVPAGWRITVARPPATPALADLDAAIGEALARPLAPAPLRALANAAAERAATAGRPPRAVVVVTDATRDCPDERFLPALLREIGAGGIAPADTLILVATGLHRPSTDEEKRRMLGPAIVERYRVSDHDALDPAAIVDLGRTAAGVPITTNRAALEADLLVATGVVEPHQYAGFSGGAKTVAIGVAGEATIAATHGIEMLDHPAVRLARLDGNPFHEAVVEIGRRVGLAFVVNVVADPEGRPLAVAAGEPEAVHHHLAAIATRACAVRVSSQADVAVAGVGASKAANLYQASRAVTYLHFGPVPAVRRGGAYVLPAAIREGGGAGVGERRFVDAMRASPGDPEAIVEHLRRDGARAGEQRAYLLASVLRDTTVVVAGAEHPEVAEACGLRAAGTLDESLAIAGAIARDSLPRAERRRPLELLVVPHAIGTLALVEDGADGGDASAPTSRGG